MTITFRINYHTKWGENIVVIGDAPELGNGRVENAFSLKYTENGFWEGTLSVDYKINHLAYKYYKIDNDFKVIEEEWGAERVLKFDTQVSNSYYLVDTWRVNQHFENSFYTSAFKDVIFKPKLFNEKTTYRINANYRLKFQSRVSRIERGLQLCVLGNIQELGEWNPQHPLLLTNLEFPIWSGDINLKSYKRIEYKYGLFDPRIKKVILLEQGANRVLKTPFNSKIIVKTDEYFNHPDDKWKGSGVAVPVFSLRSNNGFGIGEFLDIKLLVDWAIQLGLKMIQLLPINDTIATKTWKDSYPYACISALALHPIYLNLNVIEGFDEAIDSGRFETEKNELNQLPHLDFEKVCDLKLKYTKKLFSKNKAKFLEEIDFLDFIDKNKHWLLPYALFSFFRDKYGTSDFNQWGGNKIFSSKLIEKYAKPNSKNYGDIAFYFFLQYHLDKQLKDASGYARKNGVVLKGDIPIGIYRYSVDAWSAPNLFNMSGQSGAPPDPFSEIGQNWGFPTYNWEEMAKDEFKWWKERFKELSKYFDSFRIDHILGFFRIWEIPIEQMEGIFGVFRPAIPIDLNEFEENGILFDRDRFCKPYITDKVLSDLFGEKSKWIIDVFLEKRPSGFYAFKQAFDTQRKLDNYFKSNNGKSKEYLKLLLFKLIGNVLFFEVKGAEGTAFHPRIDFQKTSSFKSLDEQVQQVLDSIYQNYFYKRQEDYWRREAMKKLPSIKAATNMLICGEDLGMVPDCVPGVMQELDILSLEIQRMSKNPLTEFLQPHDIPYLSVCTPGTHDMSPLRLWWEEMEEDQRCRFYWYQLGMKGMPPVKCEPPVIKEIFKQHLLWPSMWVVFSIQDIFALDDNLRSENPADERINIPANPDHYWRYRMHLPMEDLIANEDFNDQFSALLSEAGRGKSSI